MRKAPTFPIILNQANALKFKDTENKILKLAWHKFIIHQGARLDKKEVLKNIVNVAGDIFPIQYEINGKNSSFIARNCSSAIKILCSHNLTIKCLDEPIFMSVWLSKGVPTETTRNIQTHISEVLNKRFIKEIGILNLENFVDDPDLIDKVYCSLTHPKVLTFVLSLISRLNVKCLRLNNNELTDISGLAEATWACPSLYSIDLRNNLIDDVSKLLPIKMLKITELWLDENPLCADYQDYDYILDIKEIFPNIQRLDGEDLFENRIPISRRNYLLNYSSIKFVDQFIGHYFTFYDSNDRESLNDLYHPEALFSLNCSFVSDQITSTNDARLNEYQRISRNLLNMKDCSKHGKWLYHSCRDIVKVLSNLPQTKHDPYTFTVDLIYYSKTTAVIVVTGVFKESIESITEPERLLHFTRTFVLSAASDGEYNIVNEQLHISNPTTLQANEAFKNDKDSSSPKKGELYTSEEQLCIIETFMNISKLDTVIAKRLLEHTEWNLKVALTLFVNDGIQQIISGEMYHLNNNPSPLTTNYQSTPIINYVPNVQGICEPTNKILQVTPNVNSLTNTKPLLTTHVPVSSYQNTNLTQSSVISINTVNDIVICAPIQKKAKKRKKSKAGKGNEVATVAKQVEVNVKNKKGRCSFCRSRTHLVNACQKKIDLTALKGNDGPNKNVTNILQSDNICTKEETILNPTIIQSETKTATVMTTKIINTPEVVATQEGQSEVNTSITVAVSDSSIVKKFFPIDASMQESDPVFQTVIDKLRSGQKLDDYTIRNTDNMLIKHYGKGRRKRVCLPEFLLFKCFTYFHIDDKGVHLYFIQTLREIFKRFWRKNLFSEVKYFYELCPCLKLDN